MSRIMNRRVASGRNSLKDFMKCIPQSLVAQFNALYNEYKQIIEEPPNAPEAQIPEK